MQILLKLIVILFFGFQAQAYNPEDVVPNEIIIKFKDSHSSFAVQGKLAATYQLKSEKKWNRLNIHQFKTKAGDNIDSVIQAIQQDPSVEFVEPNFYVYASNLPNPMTSVPVRIRESWAILPSNPGAIENLPIVAVIDSGLDLTHPVYNQTDRVYINLGETGLDSQGRNRATNGIDDDGNGYVDDVNGWNFANNSSNVTDDTGHGTHVSGIVLGSTENIFDFQPSNSPRVQILPLKFLNNGVGRTSDAINAINYAINQGAKVINNSWGGTSYSSTLHSALTTAYNSGIVIVSAAGNSSSNNDNNPVYPASLDLPSMISVASTSTNRAWSSVTDSGPDLSSSSDRCKSSFTNFGANSVDVFAPGNAIYSTIPASQFNGYGTSTGTSMAAPFVAGLAAMISSVAPNLSGFQIKEILMDSADYNPVCEIYIKSGRRINFERAIIEAYNHRQEVNTQPGYTPLYNQGTRGLASSDQVSSGIGCGRVTEFYNDQNNSLFQSRSDGNTVAMDAKVSVDILFLLIPLFLLLALRRYHLNQINKRVYDRKTINMPGQMILDNGWVLPVNVKDISSTGAGIQLLGETQNFNYNTSSGHMILNLIFGNGEKVRYKAKVVRSTEDGFVGVKFSES